MDFLQAFAMGKTFFFEMPVFALEDDSPEAFAPLKGKFVRVSNPIWKDDFLKGGAVFKCLPVDEKGEPVFRYVDVG